MAHSHPVMAVMMKREVTETRIMKVMRKKTSKLLGVGAGGKGQGQWLV